MKYFIALLLILHPFFIKAQVSERAVTEEIIGNQLKKLSYHEAMYIIGGDDDLKLQFSFKYRLSQEWNVYLAFTQLMFWDVYEDSKPFRDVNYRPEFFYRFYEKDNDFLRSLDIGYVHFSNGRDELYSRSVERFILRSSIASRIGRNILGGTFTIQHLFDEDITNRDIKNYLGFWDLKLFLRDFVIFDKHRLDLTFDVHAGSKIIDFDKGAYQLGLLYKFTNSSFNPAIYLQRFEGYGESLLTYNKKRVEHRIGIMMMF